MSTCDDCQRSTAGACWRHSTTYRWAPATVVWTNPLSIISTGTTSALCPDLLRYEQIGAADGWRGRLVRWFFWLLRAWPP